MMNFSARSSRPAAAAACPRLPGHCRGGKGRGQRGAGGGGSRAPPYLHTHTHPASFFRTREEQGWCVDRFLGRGGGARWGAASPCRPCAARECWAGRAVPGERAPCSRAFTWGRLGLRAPAERTSGGAGQPDQPRRDLFNPLLFFPGAGKQLWLPRVWERGKLKEKKC